ncbi:MAG: PD-(D/E)XK nuclease family protein [Kiritimatiellales bacterium]|jgi:hypothetical protein
MLESDKQAMQMVQSLAKVAREIEKLEHAREVHLKATHGRFNLFTTLLAPHEEVCLHTRYLEHLLNPNGTHDCDGLFLDLFLKAVGLSGLDAKRCKHVENERVTGKFGNIDIYLEFEDAILVIENKIYAGDQPKQLQRYFEYAKQRNKGSVHVLYLTLDGHEPSQDSRGYLEEGSGYRRISYREDILKWLENCLQNTFSFVNINQALQQYRALVKWLCGEPLEGKYMDKIKDMIKACPDIVRHAKEIKKVLEEIEWGPTNEAQKSGQAILGKDTCSTKLEDWGVAKAVRFFCSKKWENSTHILLKIYNDGPCDLFAFVSNANSQETLEKLKNIMEPYVDVGWGTEGKWQCPYCCQGVPVGVALEKLEGFARKLDQFYAK